MVSKKVIEEYRKKECYCAEISEQKTCKKCNQELPEWENNKCMICGWIDNLLKFAKGRKG